MAPNPINNKKSVLGLVKETTEGVPVRPSLATHYTALQSGFQLQPSFDTLQNDEQRASIGKSKDEIGAENPTFSFAHYIKASGVIAQVPDFGILIESCLGAVVIAANERQAQAASTATLIKLSAGQGVEFQRGQAMLVQTSGAFEIRNALSIAGDDVTLAQKLKSSPVATTLLGRAILYKVLDEGHPTLTVWNYRGNGGAIEMISGCRVTELSIEAQANQYINGSFQLGGVSYYFNPILITATNKYLDFTDDDGDHAVVLAEKEYKTPHQLAAAINAGLSSLSLSDAITCEYLDASGKFKFTSVGTLFELLGNTGVNAANNILATLGFTVAADKTGAITYTSDTAQSWAAPHVPDFDDSNANVAKAVEVIMGDGDDVSCFGAQRVTMKITNTKTDIPDLCEESGKSGSLFTAREVTIEVVSLLQKHDADKFKRFSEGEKTQFTFNWGVKQGGQWKKGSCVNAFVPTATITSFEIQDQDGLAILSTTLTAYVEDGQGELYLNFI